MRSVIERKGNVYYCDTDSVVSDIKFPSEIVDEAKLGYWALEAQPIRGLFLRPKVYTETFIEDGWQKDNIKFKGVSKETQATLDYDFYKMLLHELQEPSHDKITVEKNKTLLRSIMFMQKEHLDPSYYETRDKNMNLITVEKRIMNYNENWTKPHFFQTIEEFETFNFKPVKKEVEFDMKKGGHY